jgi:hypothetical protein
MSLQRCAHLGARLADSVTCGARCGAFPACLPAPPPEVIEAVALTLRATASEHQAASAVQAALGQLHAAIAKGMTRKVCEPSETLRSAYQFEP